MLQESSHCIQIRFFLYSECSAAVLRYHCEAYCNSKQCECSIS